MSLALSTTTHALPTTFFHSSTVHFAVLYIVHSHFLSSATPARCFHTKGILLRIA